MASHLFVNSVFVAVIASTGDGFKYVSGRSRKTRAVREVAPTTPPWPPIYDMGLSTIKMIEAYNATQQNKAFDATFGITEYDFSYDRFSWSTARPMNCEETIAEAANQLQAILAPAEGISDVRPRAFVYRNLVKALPWYSTVREKLLDPQYSGFFLKFKANATQSELHVPRCTGTKCSDFYHDQQDMPLKCPDNIYQCDCGEGLPCGEYLYDHRNGSQLRQWLIDEVILHPQYGLGNENISGFFFDDFWCSNISDGGCTDPAQGPSEINKYSQQDMGLSDFDILDITEAFHMTMSAIQTAVLEHGGYIWNLMEGESYANAEPNMMKIDHGLKGSEACNSWMENNVMLPLYPENNQPGQLFGLQVNTSALPKKASDGFDLMRIFPHQEMDVANFLIARGPYAWIGWGQWGMVWDANLVVNGVGFVPRPKLLQHDFGTPLGRAVYKGGGRWARSYTKCEVEVNCNHLSGTPKASFSCL